MISEGSCDTEDWSNDAENSALHQIKLYVKIEQYSNLFDWWYIKKENKLYLAHWLVIKYPQNTN